MPSDLELDRPWWLRVPVDRIGLFLGPLAMLAWLAGYHSTELTPEANKLCAILLLTIIWWITEPIPIPATGILAIALCVVLGAVPESGAPPARVALAPFADPTVFFLIGGMFIGRAMTRHGLDRRLALSILTTRWAGRSAGSLLFAIGLAVAMVSMWVSNTAATAMIYPVTLGVVGVLAAGAGPAGADFARSPFASSLLLMTAYASSVGGLATPIGTTTNVIAMGFFRQEEYFNQPVDFLRWALVGVPMALILSAVLLVWLRMQSPRVSLDLSGLRSYLLAQRSSLGRWKRGEFNTLIVFLCVVSLWLAPTILTFAGASPKVIAWLHTHLPEEIVALFAPVLLFLLPVDWSRRQFTLEPADFRQIDWGTLLLFGTGLSLGNLMFKTRLAEAIGQNVFEFLGTGDIWVITAMAIGGGILLSEFTSNAATATTLIPVVLTICKSAGVDPLMPMMGVTFGASFGSALPVSTPPNAIVYGSGLLPARRMIAAGIGFDVCVAVVVWSVLRAAYELGWSPFAKIG